MESAQIPITRLLQGWSGGDRESGDRLAAAVYLELKRIASKQLARERAGHTLQPTALVNEAFAKLLGGQAIDWQNRAHFFAVAARVIRQVLVDSGRARHAQRRDGGERVTLNTGLIGAAPDAGGIDVLALDQALNELAALHPEQAQVVELRYFGGLSMEETAAATGLSTATVGRYWRAARAWLFLRLDSTDQTP